MTPGAEPAVVCLTGPTGAGKSDAALHLARVYGGSIINADSRQVYRDFPLVTAQPSIMEQASCPHALYGFLDTTERMSAGRWAVLAEQQVRAALAAGRLPVLVGGTGLYLRALLDGMADIPPIPEEIRTRLAGDCARLGLAVSYARLRDVDPVCAARLHGNDRQRILRGLEVYEATGKPLSWWQAERTGSGMPWRVLRLGLRLPLAALTPLLQRRIEAMLTAGAEDEARAALERCPDLNAPGWSGIGCAELAAYVRGELGQAEAGKNELRRLWLANTRAYAKRQLTWFGADTRIRWFSPEDPERHTAMAGAVEAFVSGG